MSGGSKKGKKKKILNSPGKEISRSDEEEDELTESTAMATPNASFDSISKQIQAMQKELKIDLKTVKDDNTTQVKNELAAFKEDINQKLVKINADVEGQNDKVDAALTRTADVEQWSTDAKRAMKDILKEQKIMMDKLDDLGPVHTKPISWRNRKGLVRFGLPSTRSRRIR